MRIRNTGAKAFDSCFVTLTANSTTPIAAEWMRFDPPLLSGQSRWDTLMGSWTNSVAGCHDMQVITSTPNDRDDNFPVDDTLNKIICILDVLDTYPYCNSFDQASDPNWLHKNALIYDDGLNSWRAGTPGKTTINAANSAPWAYIAGFKSGLYKNRDTSALFTPAFAVDTNINYSINFKHWFKTERYHDGGTVEVTMDGGTTWQVVGYAGQDWFNTPYVTILEIIKPGWTGVSNGYIDAEQVIRFSEPGNAIFRFRFMTDQSIIEEGWAIDDFCFDTTSANFDFTVGVDELPEMPVAVGLPSPNPSRTTVNLPFLLNDGRDVNFTIVNAMGQVVYRKSDRYVPGNHELRFDVSQWANGLYFIVVETGDTPVTRKLVVQH